ncbi:reverse transcriptase [Lithospermum erythrorhizon]|uniref:Reverse transcriptase n=1 Tax=Lithospermum erythrorhizon TaxID=34254 RepID=A0AAV3R2B4_LITER
MMEHPSLSYYTKCNNKIPCLAFADDCLIFYNGTKSSLSKITQLLDHYQAASGQVLNKAKSTCILSSKLTPNRRKKIQLYTCFNPDNLPFNYLGIPIYKGKKQVIPFNYLGIPIYKGKKQVILFDALLDRIKKTISSWEHRFLSYGGKIVLIQAVLSSLPLYYLQVLKMPEQIKTRIGIIFNKFLWGDRPGCSWKKLCSPFEGGLNFRSLDDLYAASMMKAWYRMREGNSIWSKFMLSKYCRIRHPSVAKVRPHQSKLWKNITKFREITDKHIIWSLGKGNCDLWLESWLPSGPLNTSVKSGVMVHHMLTDNKWDPNKLQLVLSQQQVKEVLTIPIHKDSQDTILWKLTNNGNFDFKSAWQIARTPKSKSTLFNVIWHSSIPKKKSFLTWRHIHNWIPMESIQQQRGTSLASKCVCCSETESIDHVFFKNTIAYNIWRLFAEIFGASNEEIHNTHQAIKVWSLSSPSKGHIRHIVPIIILWVFWEARNKKKHTGRDYSFQLIRKRIQNFILNLGRAELMQYKHWKGNLYVAVSLSIPILQKRKNKPQILLWTRPPLGQFKLNVDGAFKEGHAGARAGRDHERPQW